MNIKVKYFIIGALFSVLTMNIGDLISKIDVTLNNNSYLSNKGYVEESETAIRIAEAVCLQIYGEDIYKQKPFIATLKDNVWTVEGTLPANKVGGVVEVNIMKKDGRILKVNHSK